MAVCAKCGTTLAEGAGFCSSCGAPAAGPSAGAAATSSGLTSNVAAMLAYFTIIPAILFLLIDPYNKDKFVRFNAFQSLFLGVAWIILWMATWVLMFIPILGWIIDFLAWLFLGLGGLILWVLLIYKAYNNQKIVLPVIGKMAEEQAGK